MNMKVGKKRMSDRGESRTGRI